MTEEFENILPVSQFRAEFAFWNCIPVLTVVSIVTVGFEFHRGAAESIGTEVVTVPMLFSLAGSCDIQEIDDLWK